MKILITGAAGFIGFNFCNFLLKKSKFQVIGVDNLNNYYDINLKKKRLNILKKNKNFKFYKIDLVDSIKIRKIFINNNFSFVFNFAAQAGVRYSIKHPRKYIDSNIQGFFNVIDNCKRFKVKRLFYASSSSVYGENKNFPLAETEKIFPKNIYGLTKKINEEISFIYNQFYKLKTTGLRFFTVYGEWGRPDMMIVKYIDCFYKKRVFKLYNFGNHSRDFTYINDVVQIMFKLLKNNTKLKDNEILNICSSKPIDLRKIINYLKNLKIKPKIKKISLQKADILKTHGDNSKLLKYIKHNKFSDWKVSINKIIEWYNNEMI